MTVGQKVRATRAYLEANPAERINCIPTKPSRLTGLVGTIVSDVYGDGSRYEVDFGVTIRVGKATYTTFIMAAEFLEAAKCV
ncbi:MAG TPA: hypothetical protein VGI19_14580 [Candidatus Cybelea sp.]|jgi:hypothetical protein